MTQRLRKKPRQSGIRRRIWRGLAVLAVVLTLALVAWLVYLDFIVRDKFDGRKWALPARVYAQPLELYTGRLLTLADLRHELTVLEYRPVARVSQPGQWSYNRGRIEIYIRAHQVAGKSLSARQVAFALANEQVVDLQVLQGDRASLVALEPALIGGIYPGRHEDRDLVRLSEVPPLLGEALIAVEDRAFVRHWGVSPKAIARAALVNFKSGRVVQGGSTLTQQLVKNFFLTQSRDLSRKLTEAAMAVLLELHYSKAEILETYMNEIYLGQSGPRQIHGFGLAARHYFKRPIDSLKTEEIALLVGLVKGASYYNPWRNPKRATARRNLVLEVMGREGLLAEAEVTRLQSRPLGVVAESERQIRDYPAFIDLVKQQLQREYSEESLSSEGLQIYTTLSTPAQRHAEQALAERLQSLEKGYRLPAASLQGAVVLTAVGSGEVEAVVGDRNPRVAGFNRALLATRPIGSLVKPAVYLSALGKPGWHLASLVRDQAIAVKGDNGEIWQPDNFDHTSHGEVLLIDALAQSYNQATASLGMAVGLDNVRRTLQNLGVEENVPLLPAVLLGALELSPLDVAAMYHTLANDGVLVPLRTIRSVVDAEGQQLRRYSLQLSEGVDPASVNLLQFALQTVMREGTGKSVYQKLPDSLALAGKTGTTNDQRDSWFAGFSGQHLAVVWLGRDDNGVTPLTGATGALHVWGDIFKRLPSRGLEIVPAADIEFLWVDGKTGKLSGENCRDARLLPFRAGQRPTEKAACQWLQNPVLHWIKRWL